MPRMKEEKIVEAQIDEEKIYFFPRLAAFILDIILVALMSSCITLALPSNDNKDKYQKEYDAIQQDFINKEIELDEYINKSVDVVYDIDYNNVPAMIVEIVVFTGYFAIFQFYNKGQTLGKKIMKIKVVNKDGNETTLNQMVCRALIANSILINLLIVGSVLFVSRSYYFYVSLSLQGLTAIILIVSLVMILIRKDGKSLHDLVCKTKVVNA